MATGDLINELYEFELPSGYVFGGSNEVNLVSVDGLAALPEIRSSDFVLLRTDGMSPGDDFYGARSVLITLEASNLASPDVISDLRRELTPTSAAAETAVAFLVPDVCDGQVALFYGRLRRRSGLIDLPWSYGLGVMAAEWVCTDPRLYSATLRTSTGVALASVTGGLTWPLTWPLDWGGAAAGQVTLNNAGSYPAPVTFTISGPVVAPRLENLTSGKTIASTISLAAGETLTIDTGARTVLLGTSSRSNTLKSTSQWWDLDPGYSVVRFAASSGTGTCSITWRDTWI